MRPAGMDHRIALTFAGFLSLACLASVLASPAPVPQTQKLVPGPIGDPGARVAVDGNFALVGTGSYDFGTNSGGRSGVQLHERSLGSGWGLRKSLAPLPAMLDVLGFGSAMAIDGETAVVSSTSLIFIYSRNQDGADQWGLVATIDRVDDVGIGLDIDGDVLAYQAVNSTTTGVYIHKRNQGGTNHWGYVGFVGDPSPAGGSLGDIDPSGYFGNHISLSGSIMAVGGGLADGENVIHLLRDGDGPGGAAGPWGIYRTLTKNNVPGTPTKLGAAFDWSDGHLAVCSLRVDAASSTGFASWVHLLTPPGAPTTSAWPQLYGFSRSGGGDIPLSFGYEIKTGADWVLVTRLYPNSVDPSITDRQAAILRDSGAGWADESSLNLGHLPAPTIGYFQYPPPGGTFPTATEWYFRQLAGRSSSSGLACDGGTLLSGRSLQDNTFTNPQSTVGVRERTFGSGWGESATLKAIAATAGGFGQAISIGRNFMAIGDPHDSEIVADSGAVTIYVRDSELTNDWRAFGRVKASDPATTDEFGYSVATDGNLLIVGAPGKLADRGGVYIFSRGAATPDTGVFTWRQRAFIAGSAARGNSRFGLAVALNRANETKAGTTADPLDERIIIGAPADKPGTTAFGSVFIYRPSVPKTYTSWVLNFVYTGSDSADKSQFGTSVVFEGDTFAAGAWFQSGGGAVYVFRDLGVSGWTQSKKITASDTSRGLIGFSLALSEDRLAIGTAPALIFPNTGGVFINERYQGGTNNWGEVKKILPPADQTSWGLHVALEKDTLVIGSPIESLAGSRSGSLYIHRRDQGGTNAWGQVKRLLATDAQPDDIFGSSVAMSRSAIAIGATGSDSRGTDAGAVYTYRLGSYEIWAGLNDLLPGQDMPYQDADSDGQMNLVEFALNSQPKNRMSVGNFNYHLVSDVGDTWLEATWFKPSYPTDELKLDFRGSTTLNSFGEYLRVTSDNPLVKVGRAYQPVRIQPKYFSRAEMTYPATN